MGQVVEIQKKEENDILTRFRAWWPKQDRYTKQAIREIVNGETSPATKEMAEEVLNFLNIKTGRNYRAVAVNLDKIKARIKSGITVQQLKSMIAIRCREWKDDEKMQQYLRPATLFNREKCEQYIAEVGDE